MVTTSHEFMITQAILTSLAEQMVPGKTVRLASFEIHPRMWSLTLACSCGQYQMGAVNTECEPGEVWERLYVLLEFMILRIVKGE